MAWWNRRHDPSGFDHGLCGVAGIALVATYHWAFSPFASAWMGDAPNDIEATRSFLRGEPFLLPPLWAARMHLATRPGPVAPGPPAG